MPAAAESPDGLSDPQSFDCDAQTAFTIGSHKLRAGEYEGAVRDLRIAVAKRPDDPEYILRLAEGCLHTRRLDEAAALLGNPPSGVDPLRIALLRSAVERARANWSAAADLLAPHEDKLPVQDRLALADSLARSERYTECSQVIARAARKHPRDPQVLRAWVADAIARQQYATALDHCDTAARRGLSGAEVLSLRAEAQFGVGNVLGKVETREMPRAAIGQLTLDGVVFARNRDGQSVRIATGDCAIVSARRALDMGFDTPALWLVYARCLLVGRQDHAAWAIVQAQRSSILEQADTRALLNAAEVALAAGKLDPFMEFIEAAAAQLPAQATTLHFTAYSRLAEEYNLRGQEAESLGFLKRAAELRPDDVEVRLRLADALWAMGEQVLACDSYRQVLTSAPAHLERRRITQRLAEFSQQQRPAVAQAQP